MKFTIILSLFALINLHLCDQVAQSEKNFKNDASKKRLQLAGAKRNPQPNSLIKLSKEYPGYSPKRVENQLRPGNQKLFNKQANKQGKLNKNKRLQKNQPYASKQNKNQKKQAYQKNQKKFQMQNRGKLHKNKQQNKPAYQARQQKRQRKPFNVKP